jgi:hypothetical protein
MKSKFLKKMIFFVDNGMAFANLARLPIAGGDGFVLPAVFSER